MVAVWNVAPMYSFGFIVPFVSAYLLWRLRDRLAVVNPRGSLPLGLSVLAIGLSLGIGGHLADVQIAQQFAFVVSLLAAVLLVFGTEMLRCALMPLAYLLLMLPFWDALTEPLHQPFQQISAFLGVRMLHVLGVPAYHEGVLIFLPNLTLEVARACSGVNYVVAVLALGIPLGYLHLRSAWRRLALIAIAILVAAFSNSVRVTLIGVLSYLEVGSPLHGPFHVLHGLFVSAIGYVVLFMGLRLLAPASPPQPPTTSPVVPPTFGWSSFSPVPAGALLILFLVVAVVPMAVKSVPVPLTRSLQDVGCQLGEWVCGGAVRTEATWWVGADSELKRRYCHPEAGEAEVWIGYFQSQAQGKELVSYRGNLLHRSAFRTLLGEGTSAESEIDVATIRIAQRAYLALFWYEIDGVVVADRYRAKWLTFRKMLMSQTNNGAMVVVLIPLGAGEEAVQRLEASKDLCRRLHTGLRGVHIAAVAAPSRRARPAGTWQS